MAAIDTGSRGTYKPPKKKPARGHVVDDKGHRVSLPAATPIKNPRVQWKSLILNGGSVHVTSDYHSDSSLRAGWHTGVDFGAKTGTGIRSPMEGVVTESGYDSGWGNYVTVKLEDGNYMFYAHLNSRNLKKGQHVGTGALVGTVGNTGSFSHGSHLHLEIRKANTGGKWPARSEQYFMDPVTYLNENSSQRRVPTEPGAKDKIPAGDTGTPMGSDPGVGGAGADGGLGLGGGGGGGGGMGGLGVKFSKKDFYAQFEAAYGDLGILLELDKQAVAENGGKSIQWAIDQAVKQRLTGTIGAARFESLLNQTAWFKKYSQDITQRLVEEKQKPGLFSSKVAERAAAFTSAAAGYGVTIPPETLKSIGRNAYVYGWNDAQVLDAIQGAAMNEPGAEFAGGQIGTELEELDDHAYQYGVQLTDADRTQLKNDVFDGKGNQAMLDQIQERSAQAYTVFADQIRQGQSLRTLAGNYFTEAANLLEQDPDSIDMTDPLFQSGQAFQTVDPKSGQIVMRTVADFRKMVKKDSRWQTTVNAKQEAAQLTTGILKRMGLA